MECTGNDFILVDTSEQPVSNPAGLAVRLCNRRTGIGADSLIIVENSDKADAAMRFYNQDGTEVNMSGNGLRAVAKYLFDNNVNGIADNHNPTEPTAEITVETQNGVKNLTIYKLNGKVSAVSVDMGKPEFDPEKLPTTLEAKDGKIVNVPLTVNGMNYDVTCLSVGNPHCVVFCGFVDKVNVEIIGPMFENDSVFPKRINTEFVRVVGRNELKMRTWERGNGETPACGTGACAAAIAAVLNGYCPMNEDITVNVRGGKLSVKYTGDTIYLTGGAELLYKGEIEI